MNKGQPNLDLLYDKVLDFNEVQPNEYFDSVLYHLSENTSQIHNIFDNLTTVFANNPSLLNALKVIFLFVVRLGAPAFFSLEGSRIPELNLDPTTQHEELLELKRIMKYCLEKFQKMQTSHEIPNIGQKYAELCQMTQEDVSIGEIQLTEFERQYSELAIKFQQFEQRLEILVSECQDNKDKAILENTKGVQLLEQIDGLVIQPEQGFTKSENELILNFFHQKYALINKIHNELPQVAQDYQRIKEEKKAKKQQEKGEEDQKQPQDSQIQNIRDFTSFVEGTSLAAFPESMSIEYKDYIYPFRNEELRKKLKATICAFLNTNGGRILIGVGNTGFRVKGLFLTTNDQDTLIRDIDTLLKDFHPKVDPEEVITTFVPIKKKDNMYKPGFYIVKILVKRGKPNDLYFVGRDCYKRRNGQNDVQMPGNFKRDIIDRAAITIQTHPEFFKDRGEFNDPAPELGIPITNIKEKRTFDTKPTKTPGIKQKQVVQIASITTKLLVKNVPNRPDIGIELKAILDPIQPLSKTLHFTKDNDVVLTFIKPEDTKTFLDYMEGNPIVVGNNMLQFISKPVEKEKPEKSKVKVEVEDEKKDPLKVKAESSNIIWVRGIPENTTDLKEKLTVLIGDYASKLKDIKIHNKKKRATLEFESSIQANEVLNYLNMSERFIGENKVTFEKASPPSSPSQATKPSEPKSSEPAKAKDVVKTVESTKPKEIKKSETLKDTTKAAETEALQVVETNILKISNVPLEESSQEIGYLVRACNHHIKKTIEKKINKDFVLFHFKDKEDASKAYNFLTQNNFSFKGKKLKVEYHTIAQKTNSEAPKKNVKAQTNNTQPIAANPNKQETIGQAQAQASQTIGMMQPNDKLPESVYGNIIQPGIQNHDPNMLDQLIQQQQQFNPFMVQSNNSYQGDPNFYHSQVTPQFNTPFDSNYQQGFGSMTTASRAQQTGDTTDQLLKTSEVIQPDSIQFDIQNSNNLLNDPQQQQQFIPLQNQASFGQKVPQQNVVGSQHSAIESQPLSAQMNRNPISSDQKNSNQPNIQKPEAPQQISQPIESQNKEFVPSPIQQNVAVNPQTYGQNQFSQSNMQSSFMQDPKLLNQQNAYQYPQVPQVGGPQQSIPQTSNQSINNNQSPSIANTQNQPEQTNKPGLSNHIYQAQQVHPNYYSQFPQQQLNQQLGGMQSNQVHSQGPYPVGNAQTAHLNKNLPQNLYQQNNNYTPHWPQNQTQGSTQQQFAGYPLQQFNQGQQYVQSQNVAPQFQQINSQGQYVMQQGQYPMQAGQFTGQINQYPPFQGGFANGKVGQMDQNQATIQQTATLQAGKNPSTEALGKKQPTQNQLQGPAQLQGQVQGQGHLPMMGNQQNFGGPSYYSGYPQGHMPGNFSYGQQLGYNQNMQNVQNLRPEMMYQNPQGNMQGNLQSMSGNQGLTPQQLQQLQMQQMQFGGIQTPQYVSGSSQPITK